MSTTPMVQVRKLSKSFPGVKALEDVDLEVEGGFVHALMGENGAGKSTLMKILGGLHTPDTGDILFRGESVRIRTPHDALRLGIAMIHQELLPFENLTVAENICMGREPTRWLAGWVDKTAMNREAAKLLGRLGVALTPTQRMSGLSVAEVQTVEIAKALAHNASVIIMDEPTTAISEREVVALFSVIRDLKQRGVAVIYISHKMDEVFQIADTITVLRDGRRIATHPAGELDERAVIRLMVGRNPTTLAGVKSEPGGPVLKVRNLARSGKFQNINFILRRREILGLAGLMGAGRTDVVNAIYGLSPAEEGEIQVEGRSVRIRSPKDALAAGIALVSEDRKRFGLIPQMSLRQNLTLCSERRVIIDHQAENALANDQMRKFMIKASSPGQPVVNLSGGNQQKVVIAKALLAMPDILMLDEPTRGIDVGVKAEVHGIIRDLAHSGKAILLVSSELPELLSLSDRLLVMREGSISAELDPRRTSQEEIMRFAMPY